MSIAGPFDRPIPGQSLTTEPRNNPWEQPAEMSDVNDIAKFYIEKLANPDVLDDLAAMAQAGVPITPIVEGTYLQGVMRGLHTLDAALVVAPVMHMFLKMSFKEMGIDAKDSTDDPQARASQAEMNRFMMLATKYLEDEDLDMGDPGAELLSDIVEDQGAEEEMTSEEEKPMGLMAKG
jgi:hypothetical protein